MMKEERQQAILNILNSSGFVEVSQLCRVFDVTEMTIRRDLNELAAKNGATEELKARDQMAWVGLMNGLKNQAEEVILAELIYA